MFFEMSDRPFDDSTDGGNFEGGESNEITPAIIADNIEKIFTKYKDVIGRYDTEGNLKVGYGLSEIVTEGDKVLFIFNQAGKPGKRSEGNDGQIPTMINLFKEISELSSRASDQGIKIHAHLHLQPGWEIAAIREPGDVFSALKVFARKDDTSFTMSGDLSRLNALLSTIFRAIPIDKYKNVDQAKSAILGIES